MTAIPTSLSDVKDRERILVIDSDQDMTLPNHMLEMEGFDTIVLVDCDEALTMLDKVNPDLVIMDTYTPDTHCLETMDNIRKHSNVPIIIITADHELDTLKTVFAHGADDFIRKPFEIRLFIARIKAKLRRYRGKAPIRP